MDDLMGKIQSILSDKESMEQISQLAQMFSQPQDIPSGQDSPAGGPPPQPQSAAPFSSAAPQGNESAGFDIGTVMALQSVMAKASAPDKNRDFLIALKPLLKDESQRKIDKLVAVLRIMAVLPLLKESGILGGDLLGGL